MKKAYNFIDFHFSYNGNLAELQYKSRSNMEFVDALLGNDIISHDEAIEARQEIADYFKSELLKIAENPFNTLRGM